MGLAMLVATMERVLIVIGLLCLLLGAGCYSTVKYDEYNAGNAAFNGNYRGKNRDLDSALRAYSRVLQQDSTMVLAFNNRGNIWQYRDSLFDALGDYSPVLFNRPEEPEAFFNRAKAYQKLRNYRRTIVDYTRALENFIAKMPDSLKYEIYEPGFGWRSETMEFIKTPYGRAIKESLLFRGVCNRLIGDFDAAIFDLDRAIWLDPCDPQSYFQLGNCYQQNAFEVEEDLQKCAAYYKLALRNYALADSLTPDTSTTLVFRTHLHFQRANVFLASGEYLRAKNMFDSLIYYHSDNATYHFRSGNCAQAIKEFESAIVYYSDAIYLDSLYPDPYFVRGNCHFVLNRKDLAAADYSQLLMMLPKFADGYFMRGICRADLGDTLGAQEDLTKAGELGHPDAFKELGDLNRKGVVMDSLAQ